jgi:hypothetical protein
MFIKIKHLNSNALSRFVKNLPIDGKYYEGEFNNFTCTFNDLQFDNLTKYSLELMFKDGRYVSPFLEWWLDQNTNLTLIKGNKKSDFFDENKIHYQLKTFTRNGMNFRPSSQIGTGRSKDQESFEEYCRSQSFIVGNITKFPVVEFRVFTGVYLLDTFKFGVVPFNQSNILFP